MPTPRDVLREDVHHDIDMHVPWLTSVAKGNIFEIGVRTGISTAAFLVGLEMNGGHLFSVDIEEQCGKVLESQDWTFIHDSSRNVDAVKSKIPPVLDILFVDGDHTYEGTRDDFTNYVPMVRSGGLIICHDVCSGYDPGVQQAFYELFASMPQKTTCVMTVIKSWVGIGSITVP
jgi:predicted O-methyltransferase YrrM